MSFDSDWTTVTIPPGEVLTRLSAAERFDPGIYKFEFEINPSHWVIETDYADNIEARTLTVRSKN